MDKYSRAKQKEEEIREAFSFLSDEEYLHMRRIVRIMLLTGIVIALVSGTLIWNLLVQ